jgi:hypothetical protein
MRPFNNIIIQQHDLDVEVLSSTFGNGKRLLHEQSRESCAPHVVQVDALIIWTPSPAIGLPHVKAHDVLCAHLNQLTVHCGAYGDLEAWCT